MPLRLDSIITKKLSARSERVKSVDLHPTEPWVLSALYSGHAFIWNYKTEQLEKSFEVVDLPVRCARFIPRKNWFVCGADDMFIRVYNYNTMEKVAEFEAHMDYIRFVEVHPTLSCFLSCSDDLQIKLWDWTKDFRCIQTYDGHMHYVMMTRFNPKDPNYFASASLDKTVRVWSIGGGSKHSNESAKPNFTLEGHEQGVNCVAYYTGGDRPFLLSGSDDMTVRVWDYQTKACVQILKDHTANVSAVEFHPIMPIIITGSEDGTVRMWHNTTYRCESTLNYGMERVWALSVLPGSHHVAIGFDEGSVCLKLGRDLPVCSMDRNGKVVWAKNNDIQTSTVKGVAAEYNCEDGDVVPLNPKDLGRCELFPQSLKHNPNGSFIAVCGDGEYLIYTARKLRNKAFGNALDFVWADQGSGDYAVRLSASRIQTFKNFKEHNVIKLPGPACNMFGGAMLTVVGSGGCVWLYDWETCSLIQQIDVSPTAVYWSDSAELVALCCETEFYVLRCNRDKISEALNSGELDEEDGVEDAFELEHEITDACNSGLWVGDCFLYTMEKGTKLHYFVGGQVITLAHTDRPLYLLGYIAKENRLFLVDKKRQVVSYALLRQTLEYQTAVVREEFDTANAILPSIPKEQHNKIAQFLESQGFKKLALRVATDPDLRFDLAVELNQLEAAAEIMTAIDNANSLEDDDGALRTDHEHKWKKLGDLALAQCDLALAHKCVTKAGDVSAQLLMSTCCGDAKGVETTAKLALEKGRTNVAFTAYFLLGKLEECIEILIKAGRVPEAAFMARTYLPSEVPRLVSLWRANLQKVSKKAAESLADPSEYANLFPDLPLALKAENFFKQRRAQGSVSASMYPQAKNEVDLNLIEVMREMEARGGSKNLKTSPSVTKSTNKVEHQNQENLNNENENVEEEEEERKGEEGESNEEDVLQEEEEEDLDGILDDIDDVEVNDDDDDLDLDDFEE
eukprot:g4205.t1